LKGRIVRQAGLARHAEPSPVSDVDFDLVAFLESERLPPRRREANRKAVLAVKVGAMGDAVPANTRRD
jgi:hypothetical protein